MATFDILLVTVYTIVIYYCTLSLFSLSFLSFFFSLGIVSNNSAYFLVITRTMK